MFGHRFATSGIVKLKYDRHLTLAFAHIFDDYRVIVALCNEINYEDRQLIFVIVQTQQAVISFEEEVIDRIMRLRFFAKVHYKRQLKE